MTRVIILLTLISAGVLLGQQALASSDGYAAGGAQQCLSCHDYSDDSPAHLLLQTAHGNKDIKGSPMTKHGCESCHGPSAAHANAPTTVSPAVSFGPRWGSGIAQQDEQCLGCHKRNLSKQWPDSVHSSEKLSCTTCHDAHTASDKVLGKSSQIEVCTLCHKSRKNGIHVLSDKLPDNPPCASCHQPHGNPSAKVQMLHNRSQGCNQCHDLVAMTKNPAVSAKTNSYHKTMAQQGRTCIDCHSGIAHAVADSVAPTIPQAVSKKTITLLAPGQSDRSWIFSEHPGSQPLRQGIDCEQCHRGEEANMATAGADPLRDISIGFRRQQGNLAVTLSWRGSAQDQQVAMMWGDDADYEFGRGACWAACHSDMQAMTRGQGLNHYLITSRSQQQRIGMPAQFKPQAELDKLIAAGGYVEMWQLTLAQNGSAGARSATVLDSVHWADRTRLDSVASYKNGRWTVSFTRPLDGASGEKAFIAGKLYTFGVALQGAGQETAAHWVSLPMTFSLNSKDSDFTSAQ